ncbi:hypothetical protein CH13_gp033 [Mycobacterium phage Echild]|uniref:hypothetical protein n=1 Tax=Mycobacterium phage Echild TaxID=1437839 RepID=UPI0003E36193|nr:hypothetical protein CH13_gp033 [Mycobacterium phage Echild]AHG24254.1 hypothetical protein PBI_ECHILD_33 [Mycobacterium phage Echild]
MTNLLSGGRWVERVSGRGYPATARQRGAPLVTEPTVWSRDRGEATGTGITRAHRPGCSRSPLRCHASRSRAVLLSIPGEWSVIDLSCLQVCDSAAQETDAPLTGYDRVGKTRRSTPRASSTTRRWCLIESSQKLPTSPPTGPPRTWGASSFVRHTPPHHR